MKDMYSVMVGELLQFFLSEKYTIVGAANIEHYPHPAALENDGYGDQHAYPTATRYDWRVPDQQQHLLPAPYELGWPC